MRPVPERFVKKDGWWYERTYHWTGIRGQEGYRGMAFSLVKMSPGMNEYLEEEYGGVNAE